MSNDRKVFHLPHSELWQGSPRPLCGAGFAKGYDVDYETTTLEKYEKALSTDERMFDDWGRFIPREEIEEEVKELRESLVKNKIRNTGANLGICMPRRIPKTVDTTDSTITVMNGVAYRCARCATMAGYKDDTPYGLDFAPEKEIRGKNHPKGPLYLREAEATEEFFEAWRENKDAVKDAGFALGPDQAGNWMARLWSNEQIITIPEEWNENIS